MQREYKEGKVDDRMIKQITSELRYHKISWSVGHMQISYLPQPSTSIDLLAIYKLRYFDQPRPIIVNFEVLIQQAFRKVRPKTVG